MMVGKAPMNPDAAVLYRAGRVFDGVSPGAPAPAGLLVKGGRVVQVIGPGDRISGADARTVDLDGATIVPGFVDSHTHITLRPGEGNQDGQAEAPAVWQTIRGVANLRRMLE